MKLAEIHRAVDEGLNVCWQNTGYRVVRSEDDGQYYIKSILTGHSICLTWRDGMTLNGKEDEFFVDESMFK